MASPVSYQADKHNQISAIVDHVLFKKTLPDNYWQWFLEMGLWKLRELRLDVWQDVKTELLPVTNRRTVILPGGFVDWTKVGVKVGQYLVTLGVNDKLNELDRSPNSTDFVAGLLSQNLPNGLDFNSYGGYYFFNYNGGNVPCAGGGFATKGSFKVRETNGVKELLLDYDYNYDYVLIEYITDGFDPCEQTIVDPYFSDYTLKGMELEWEIEKQPGRTEASIGRRQHAFNVATRVVRARKNDLDPKTLINISRAQTRFTSKI